MTDQYDEGYPESAAEDLDPGDDVVESLDDADRELSAAHTVEPEGRRPEGAVQDEDRLEDAHDADEVDDAESREHIQGGSGPVDRSNFNDNTADWSRSRS